MRQFEGRIAVVTGGGSGIGRALVRKLAGAGVHVAMCDVSEPGMQESRSAALADAPEGVRVSTCVADVSDETSMVAFADNVRSEHDTDHVHLVFNNAGIGGGGSFVAGDRDEWERVFGVIWGGVYNGCRVFLPLLVAAPEGHLVNVSSINGFWATIGPQIPHTAYSAAKFAVKGFTEALINDLRVNAPHVGVSVVMPGHVGTSIVSNSADILGQSADRLGAADFAQMRAIGERVGADMSEVDDDALRELWASRGDMFRDGAPTSAEEAATVILDGVRASRWRILVGDDAVALDGLVRATPEDVYEQEFLVRHDEVAGLGQLGS